MALIEDDASAHFDRLPEKERKYRYMMNGLPELIGGEVTPEEAERMRRSCLGGVIKIGETQ
jgi:hypothetical protein